MKKIFVFLLSFSFEVAMITAVAQQPATAHKQFTKADSAAINALVLYPDTIRLDIFEACKYPELIVLLANEQKNTSAEFANMVSGYSQKEQEDLWDLTRYPQLISKMAEGGKKSSDQLNVIVAPYPDEIRETAQKYGKDYYDVLKKINDLQLKTSRTFDQRIADYPAETRDAYSELIQLPEVLTILKDHLDIAVLAGDHYKRDPKGIIRTADSLNMVITRQNAEEVQAWKDSLQNDPQAAADLKKAATDYATEEGYSQSELITPVNSNVIVNYTCYPYPYWFGYPVWCPYSYWYPYPYWYDWGFYYGPYGGMIFFGIPSYNFINWYFYYPVHWHHYPHLGHHYVSHYYGPRRAITCNSGVVHRWVRDNRIYLPGDFLTNKTRSVESIRELGQLHTDVQTQKGGRVTPADRDQYLQNNKTRFPELNATKEAKLQLPERAPVRQPEVIQQPVKQPPVRLPKAPEPERREPPLVKPAPSPRYDYEKMNKAQDYHRNIWEQAPTVRPQPAPQRQPTAPQILPQPRVQPQPRPFTPPPVRQMPAPSKPGGR